MIYRHPKRWCDDCKMMVLARGHAHGQESEGSEPVDTQIVCNAADVDRAFRESRQHIIDAKKAADVESQRILNERLKSAVGQVK